MKRFKWLVRRVLTKVKNILFFIIYPLVRIFEKKYIRKYSSINLKHQPVFIVGAPRTGSTIFYQALTNYFDTLYFDNIVSLWHKAIIFGFYRSSIKYGNHPHNCFASEHGVTQGEHSPSECGEFWYRWLPRDHHFIDYDEIDTATVRQLREEIGFVSDNYRKPFVFKNLNAGQRLRLISTTFPKARIVFIRRNPVFVLRSILKARKKLGIGPGVWWSIKPSCYKDLLGLAEIDMCAAQVFYLERQILEDSKLFPKYNIHVINYNDFSADNINALGREWGFLKRAGGSIPDFNKDVIAQIPKTELALLENALAAYPFTELKHER